MTLQKPPLADRQIPLIIHFEKALEDIASGSAVIKDCMSIVNYLNNHEVMVIDAEADRNVLLTAVTRDTEATHLDIVKKSKQMICARRKPA